MYLYFFVFHLCIIITFFVLFCSKVCIRFLMYIRNAGYISEGIYFVGMVCNPSCNPVYKVRVCLLIYIRNPGFISVGIWFLRSALSLSLNGVKQTCHFSYIIT